MEEEQHDWFEYIKLDIFSTKMELKDRILLVESRNFPKLIKKHIDSVLGSTDGLDKLTIHNMRKFMDVSTTPIP